MLHVRVVSPAALTGSLNDRLAAAPGVRNVVVSSGAARRPDRDAVQFDVRDGAANPVLAALREFGLDRDGVICVERVDATLAGPAVAAGNHGALRQETAPVWEMVEAVIRQGEAYAPSFYILLAVAGLIGAVGVLTNSTILIVGAMVVGPEYNAIIGVALGLTRRVRAEVRDGLLALGGGFLAAILMTLLFGLAVRVVSLTESRANALIGVFISVTTVPAAASVGLSIAYSSWGEARGSMFQLLLNVLTLIAVGAAGLCSQRAIWHRRSPLAGDAQVSRALRPPAV
jgi:hypothetical protein